MTNIDKVSAALSEWAFNISKSLLPNVTIPPQSAVGKFMLGILGMDPTKYNVWDELGFLAEPLIQTMVTPTINRMLDGIPDEQTPELEQKFVDAFIEQAKKKGGVNVFGIEVDKDDFQALKAILTEKVK